MILLKRACLQKSFFDSLGDAEFDHGLGWDFDFRTSCWVAAHTSGALDFDQLAEARKDEFAVLFDLRVSRFGHEFHERDDFLLGVTGLGRKLGHELRLGHFRHMCGNP